MRCLRKLLWGMLDADMGLQKLASSELEEAARLLRSGEPVAIPTETVYGLAAPIFHEKCIRKIFTLKGRPADNPLIAHVSSWEMIEMVAEEFPPILKALAKEFWPGPITFVLPKKDSVSPLVTGGLATLAVRMPAHPIALDLIERVGEPLVAPSANLSGRPSPTCPEHVIDDFGDALSAVVDGGACRIGIESTVVGLIGGEVVLLRPGSIQKKEIEKILGKKVRLPHGETAALSPGMKYRHYAPKASIQIAYRPQDISSRFVLSTAPVASFEFRKLDASQLYCHLREADLAGEAHLSILLDPVAMSDEALMNRLTKASIDKKI